MKFLVDNQLPPALARFIQENLREEAVHLRDIGLQKASDADVWRYASAGRFILISKDEDFVGLFSKAPDAKLLWGALRKLPPVLFAGRIRTIVARNYPAICKGRALD